MTNTTDQIKLAATIAYNDFCRAFDPRDDFPDLAETLRYTPLDSMTLTDITLDLDADLTDSHAMLMHFYDECSIDIIILNPHDDAPTYMISADETEYRPMIFDPATD